MPEGWSLVSQGSSDTSFLAQFSGNFGADNLVGVGDREGSYCRNLKNWRRQQSSSGFTTSYSPMCSATPPDYDTTKTYLEIKEKSTGSTTTSYYIDMGSDVSSNAHAKTWKLLIRRSIQVMNY